MATSRTAKKRIRQTEKWRLIHKARRTEVKTLTKKELSLLEAKDLEKAKAGFVELQIKLDKAQKLHSFHKNTIARKKSRLAKKLNALAKPGKK
jgi:small subunit ribosomal protein S20